MLRNIQSYTLISMIYENTFFPRNFPFPSKLKQRIEKATFNRITKRETIRSNMF